MSELQPEEGAGGGGSRSRAAERVRRDAPRSPEATDPDREHLEHEEDDASEQRDTREPHTNGERDERMQHAVEAARRAAEERATAEILALEDDLEHERQNAARSLEEVQRRLREAEEKAAATATVTDATHPRGGRRVAARAARRGPPRAEQVARRASARAS